MVRPTAVTILDTTLRDGLQIEKAIVPTDTKVLLAEKLIAAGLRQIELGSFVNPKKVPQMADTDELLTRLRPYEDHGVEFFTLVFNRKGAERAADAGAKNIKLVVSASEGHSRANSDAPIAEASERLLAAADYAREHGIRFDITTAVSFICPFDGITPAEHLVEVLRPFVEAGAQGIGIADTIGNANPSLVRTNTSAVLEAFGDLPLGLHLHDTYNFGMANVIAALDLGVASFDSAMGGLGGCPFAPGAAGNIGTDDLVHLLHREGVATGVDVEALAEVREPLIAAVGHELSSSLSQIPAVPAALAGAESTATDRGGSVDR